MGQITLHCLRFFEFHFNSYRIWFYIKLQFKVIVIHCSLQHNSNYISLKDKTYYILFHITTPHTKYNTIIRKISWGGLGTPVCTIIDEFLEKFQKGGGVISNPKNFVAKFLALETPIWGGHFRSKKFRRKKSQHFSQKRGGGGGSKAVWNFSKKSSIMVQTGFPYDDDNTIQLSYSTSHHSTFSKFERNEQEAGAWHLSGSSFNGEQGEHAEHTVRVAAWGEEEKQGGSMASAPIYPKFTLCPRVCLESWRMRWRRTETSRRSESLGAGATSARQVCRASRVRVVRWALQANSYSGRGKDIMHMNI